MKVHTLYKDNNDIHYNIMKKRNHNESLMQWHRQNSERCIYFWCNDVGSKETFFILSTYASVVVWFQKLFKLLSVQIYYKIHLVRLFEPVPQ